MAKGIAPGKPTPGSSPLRWATGCSSTYISVGEVLAEDFLAHPLGRESRGRVGDGVLGGDQPYLPGADTMGFLQHRIYRGGGLRERFLGAFALQQACQEQGGGYVTGAVDRQGEQGRPDEPGAF